MTALEKYQRLEAAALWREAPDAQRRDVIVSIGEATLMIADLQDRPLTHWSIAALARANPGEMPALYHPDGDPGETLELGADEAEMIEALEKLRSTIERRRPRKGRLRLWMVLVFVAVIAGFGYLWLPGALERQALAVLPQVKRDEIGAKLFSKVQTLTGAPCGAAGGDIALQRLAERLRGSNGALPQLFVVRSGVPETAHLPGGIVLLNRAMVEDFEDPEVTAGYIVAERLRAAARDPIARLLDEAGTAAVLRLLTTGEISDDILRAHARTLINAAPAKLSDDTLISGFTAAGIQTRPYAAAHGLGVQSTRATDMLKLIEADPFPNGAPAPVLRDSDWLRLQGICGN
ncbi:hypothetical protein DL237_11105 [Pseudooceanicola sediminis]|uniref:Peptidase M48 domain-containing protein n=1 Tax=Pseudooceanicola sediminis TaxID=2211117 RepID=A0A399J034_9RHOB|nr:hypothetical protein [Pseudooceanicola sediminis]KAA2313971.1 hypothetical protein E0K93_12805 [Puniceibacterium sp. HSS470]RII38783.1 hypothetical protein DL237_11105 [Pseudooceanicola sediminis]|tara:strand:+ start:104011 stop:105054 length:1044 start_codon:yes stop_codon:yes gene_type:complete